MKALTKAALGALVLAGVAMTATAPAEARVSVGIGIGVPGYYGPGTARIRVTARIATTATMTVPSS